MLQGYKDATKALDVIKAHTAYGAYGANGVNGL